MMQYLAQGACMALEDAVTLGEAVKACGFDMPAAFKLYEAARVARTARVVLSVREMGRLYHAKGVERLVRNSLWVGRSPERFYDAVEWLYAWRPEHCLEDAPGAPMRCVRAVLQRRSRPPCFRRSDTCFFQYP
jgi:hypothetical protein